MGMQRTDGMQRMDFETLVQTRKSVRGFTKEPVARAVIAGCITGALVSGTKPDEPTAHAYAGLYQRYLARAVLCE